MPIRPVIAVSACLLGQNVRYDGRLKTCAEVHDLLAAAADLVPLCPETGVGMPVPREPGDASRTCPWWKTRISWGRGCAVFLAAVAAASGR
ncbi:MAG TPA: DUF523 domain-containing protein [Candidatus Krumholzibacteria bacterium]|nr:DUF523 domain-containing protein [Candidatus Krumholzibacteria bacterium]